MQVYFKQGIVWNIIIIKQLPAPLKTHARPHRIETLEHTGNIRNYILLGQITIVALQWTIRKIKYETNKIKKLRSKRS